MSSCEYYTEQLEPSGYIEIPADWGVCLVNMLRAHVGDFTSPPQYSNDRLFQVVIAAAYWVVYDIQSCPVKYPQVECDGTMSENPLGYPAFVNLTILKAACIIDRGIMRQKLAMEGIRASVGPASISVLSSSRIYDAFFQYGACAAYAEMKEQLCFKDPIQGAIFAKQVVSMFISDHYRGGGGGGGGCHGGDRSSSGVNSC